MYQCAADVQLFAFYLSLGLVWVHDIDLSHLHKNNGNTDLVREKKIVSFFFKQEINERQDHSELTMP